jgi:hypothetical protein
VAGRGAEGTGGRRPLVCARAPPEREAVRPLRRRAQPGLRRGRRRASAHERGRPGDEGRGAALGGQADRRALPLDLGRHDPRRRGGLRQARALSRRRRRPAQRALARPPVGARRGRRGDSAEGAEAARAGDGAPARARALGPCRERRRRDGDGHDQGDGGDAAARGRPALDVGDAARDAVADAAGRAGPLRQGRLADGPRAGRQGRRAAAAGRGSLEAGRRAGAEGEGQAARAGELPHRRRPSGRLRAQGAGRTARDRARGGARRQRYRDPARPRNDRGVAAGQPTTGAEGDYVLTATEPGTYRVRVAPAQGFAEGLSGRIELR